MGPWRLSPALRISCDIHPWTAANVLGQMMMGSSRIINRICVHSTTTTITLTTYYYNQMYVQMTNCGSPICMIDGRAQWVDADGWMHKWLDGSGIVVLLRDDWTGLDYDDNES